MVNSTDTKVFFFDLIFSLKSIYIFIYFLLLYLSLSFSEETLLLFIFVAITSGFFYFFNIIVKCDLFFYMSVIYNFFLKILQQKLILDYFFEISCLNLNSMFRTVSYLNQTIFFGKKLFKNLSTFFSVFSLSTYFFLLGAFSTRYLFALTHFFYLLTTCMEITKKSVDKFLKKTKKMNIKLNFVSSKIEILRFFSHFMSRRIYLLIGTKLFWIFAEYGRYSILHWHPWYNCFNSVLLRLLGKLLLSELTNRWTNYFYKIMAPFYSVLEIHKLI